jgi:gluconolactonase
MQGEYFVETRTTHRAFPLTQPQRVSKQSQAVLRKQTIDAISEPEGPYFAIYDDSFLGILGPQCSISLAVEQDWPFAHEAGVYIPSQDAVFMTSNRLGEGPSSSIRVSKVSQGSNGAWSSEEIPTDLEMGNGGINCGNEILFCAQGTHTSPSGLVLVSTHPPYATRSLLDNFHGLQFNSPNDVVVHTDGSIWFTDPIYGFEQGFRPKPQLRCHVYRFDPVSGDLRAVADGLGRPNGICFSPDEKTLYVTDTDWIHGDGTTDEGRARSM